MLQEMNIVTLLLEQFINILTTIQEQQRISTLSIKKSTSNIFQHQIFRNKFFLLVWMEYFFIDFSFINTCSYNQMNQNIKQVSKPSSTHNHQPNHTRKLGNAQFAIYLKSMPRLSTLIYNIQKYLSKYPSFYYNAFLASIKGKDLDALEKQLKEQYQRLVEGKSFLHKINKAVFARQKCLQKIKYNLTKVQEILHMFKQVYIRKDKQQDKIFISYTREHHYTPITVDATVQSAIKVISSLLTYMSQLRDMTIYIIQTVHRWRVDIEQWMDKCQNHSRIDFFIQMDEQDQNSLIRIYDKIISDTDFIWDSKLCEYVLIEYKSDPLMIRNVVNVSQKDEKQVLEKYFVEILYPSNNDILDKSIKVLEMLVHVYKPKQVNLYAEEQKLIENYLGLQRQRNMEIGQEEHKYDFQEIKALNNLSLKSSKALFKTRSQSQSKTSSFRQSMLNYESQGQHRNYLNFQSPYVSKVSKSNSQSKPNERGWVFGKKLSKPATEKIREIVKRHEQEMDYIKNHKIIIKANNFQNLKDKKKQIALAYLSQGNAIKRQVANNQNQKTPKKANKLAKQPNDPYQRQYESSTQGKIPKRNLQPYDSPMENSRNKLYHSLVKINSIIQQDPKEHEHDQQTPKNKVIKNPKITALNLLHKQNETKDKFYLNRLNKVKTQHNSSKQLSKTIDKKDMKIEDKSDERRNLGAKIKINSKPAEQVLNKNGEAQIRIQSDQTPLNFKEFLCVFRADTTKTTFDDCTKTPIARPFIKQEQLKQMGEKMSLRKLIIDSKRSLSLKNPKLSMYSNSNKKLSKPKTKNVGKDTNKSKSRNKTQNSFEQYTKVQLNKSKQHIDQIQQNGKKISIENINLQQKKFINLRIKQITKDMVFKYVNHISNQVPLTCQSFTNYHTAAYKQKLLETLQDCTKHSLILDLEVEKQGKIGQAIVVESLSSNLRMRYTIQFINVHKFQFMARSVCRISEQLLSTTPCQQVILKLVEDKADPVSGHFIALIDTSLKKFAQKFSFFHILQKPILGLTHQKLFQRVYIFQSRSLNIIKQGIMNKFKVDWKKRVAGNNYRSLVFETKCVVLTNNFKLRSQTLSKPVIDIYKEESLGMMYVMLLQKIITKYHLKQLKIASLSINDADETSSLVKKSPFFRSVFFRLLEQIKNSTDPTKLPGWYKNSITKFTSMTDLLNYISYKQYDQVFKIEFLMQSRFILNHQLLLTEINLSFSLDFLLETSVGMILLNNHHNFIIEELTRSAKNTDVDGITEQLNINGYLIPTTDSSMKLFIMSAKQYISCSGNLDLFTYLELLFKESIKKERHDISQIVIPDLTKRKQKVTEVKMFDGFFRLFPQRQFYSASMIDISNLWENYYPNAVISKPNDDALIIDYPIIVGFYDCILEHLVVAYIMRQQKMKNQGQII